MALIEVKSNKVTTCLGCGRRIAVGDIVYEDDEMDQIWCKHCYDETVAEIEAAEAAGETEAYYDDESYEDETEEYAGDEPEEIAAEVVQAAPAAENAVSTAGGVSPAPGNRGALNGAAPSPASAPAASAPVVTRSAAGGLNDNLHQPSGLPPVKIGGRSASSRGLIDDFAMPTVGRGSSGAPSSAPLNSAKPPSSQVSGAGTGTAAQSRPSSGARSAVAPTPVAASGANQAVGNRSDSAASAPAQTAASLGTSSQPQTARPQPGSQSSSGQFRAVGKKSDSGLPPVVPQDRAVNPASARPSTQVRTSPQQASPVARAQAAPQPGARVSQSAAPRQQPVPSVAQNNQPRPVSSAQPQQPAQVRRPVQQPVQEMPSSSQFSRVAEPTAAFQDTEQPHYPDDVGFPNGSEMPEFYNVQEHTDGHYDKTYDAGGEFDTHSAQSYPSAQYEDVDYAHEQYAKAASPGYGESRSAGASLEHTVPVGLAKSEPTKTEDVGNSTYRLGRSKVSEADLASYPPLGVEPVAMTSSRDELQEEEDEEGGDDGGASFGNRNTLYDSIGCAPISDNSPQGLWNRYHIYMSENLRTDMLDGLASPDSRNWACISADMETVISQGAPSLQVGQELEPMLARMHKGQVLEYGWPLACVETNEGLSVAPLLVVSITQPPYDGKQVKVLSEPVINPALLRALFSSSSDVDFMRSNFDEVVPHGAVAIRRFVERISGLMNLKVHDLDPLKLVRELPTDTGMYNMAVLMLTSTSEIAKDTVQELRLIANSTDWQNSATSCLFGHEVKELEGRDTMPVMPWSAEQIFEDSLQAIRTKALTIFTLTKRDTIEQLIASACANAWIDNESILVLSDNEKRLDDIVKLSSDVHSALLVRTCTEDDLARNPKRRCHSISDLASILLREVEAASSSIRQIIEKAYQDLENVEKMRKEALKGAAFRKEWGNKKIKWETERLEVAKRIWPHGLYPQGTDPTVVGADAKALEKVSLFKSMRVSSFMRQIGAKSDATLADVVEWANISLHIKDAETELAKVNDPDRYNEGSANYRWAASSVGAVSARVSGSLPGCARTLERLLGCTSYSDETKLLVTSLVQHLRAWASTYYEAHHYFDLNVQMFDVVIFDNANHVNLAWALPWAYRAKRLVIIGDPNGIPPSIFLDGAQLTRTAETCGFDRADLAEKGLEYGSGNVFKAFNKEANT
ncbi:MAG: hypothetical protein K6A35_03255 [bacterium]|nr:hypothetical protein [bacterium]